MSRKKLLVGALVILLAAINCQAESVQHSSEEYYQRKQTVVCNGDSTPCSCSPTELTLECHNNYNTKHVESKNLESLSIKTPKAAFHPIKANLSGNAIMETFDATKFLELEQRKGIEILDLSRNSLGIMADDTFDSFDNLKFLNLSHNQIRLFKIVYNSRYRYSNSRRDVSYEWLSPKLAKTLEVLDLSYNRIAKLPDRLLSRFSNLKRLILNGNLITSLELEGLYMQNLEELSLDGCSINRITGEFFNAFPNLKKLSMRNTFIGFFPALYRMPKLKYVDLTHSRINGIDGAHRQYGNLYSIETLLLSENNIYYIGYKAFTVFPNLTKLDLHENRNLHTIDENAFGSPYFKEHPVKLEELDLSDCRLKTLDENLLPWKQLKSLKIRGNNFECNTYLSWLINDRQLPVEKGDDQPKCSSPEALEGRNFVDVKQEELDNPTETAALYYAKKALDVLTQNQQLFFFGLGVVCATILVIAIRCCCCCINCLFCAPMKKHFLKMDSRLDRLRLLEHQSCATEYKPQEDTQTIAETIPDEE